LKEQHDKYYVAPVGCYYLCFIVRSCKDCC